MNKTAKTLSLCAVFTALASAILFSAALIPTASLALAAAAGLLPMAAVIHFGIKHGLLTFAATALLSVLISPEKSTALLFAAFFGYYPVIKSVIETKIRRPVTRYAAKLAVFNLVFALIGILASRILLDNIGLDGINLKLPGSDAEASGYVLSGGTLWTAVQLIGCVVFALYDRGLSQLASEYTRRAAKYIAKTRL